MKNLFASSNRVLLSLVATVAVGLSDLRASEVGEPLERKGDEIVVCGKFYHTTAPVVLWLDPGGYDAYRVERRFSSYGKSSWKDSIEDGAKLDTPNRYSLRRDKLSDQQIEQVRGGGWSLPLLQNVVDQFVMHYDVCGVSRQCFKILHDHRGLSVHFMLDVDGTIYQTLDLKERAWHATISNSRSIGVEIAQIGAYPASDRSVLEKWYDTNTEGGVLLSPPKAIGPLGIRTDGYIGKPNRPGLITGTIQGQELCQYDYTTEQYESLIKLTATLCKIFPKLKCTYPQDADGNVVLHKLPDEEWEKFQGILGHYHVQRNKIDPGPAFNWRNVIDGATELIEGQEL